MQFTELTIIHHMATPTQMLKRENVFGISDLSDIQWPIEKSELRNLGLEISNVRTK